LSEGYGSEGSPDKEVGYLIGSFALSFTYKENLFDLSILFFFQTHSWFAQDWAGNLVSGYYGMLLVRRSPTTELLVGEEHQQGREIVRCWSGNQQQSDCRIMT